MALTLSLTAFIASMCSPSLFNLMSYNSSIISRSATAEFLLFLFPVLVAAALIRNIWFKLNQKHILLLVSL